MTRKVAFLLTLAFVVSFGIHAHGMQLPAPPAGYSWLNNEETKSAFLKPNGWFAKKSKKDDIWGYFITKEDLDKDGSFVTGLSVNIVPGIPKKRGTSPTELARQFVKVGAEKWEVVKKPWTTEMSVFKAFGVVLLNKDLQPGGDHVVHYLAIGNDTTGTFYLFTFEGPASSWEATWKVGEPMLKRFLIDSDI